MKPGTMKNLIIHLVYIFAHVLAFAGFALIFYGVVSASTGQKWLPIEPYIRPTSVYLTLFGLLVTSLSIYSPWKTAPPMEISIWISAPVAIGLVIGGLVVESKYGLEDSVINGFALLTMAGAIVRIFPRPDLTEAHRGLHKADPN